MNNIYIRTLYSPGFSSVTLSFFKTKLSVGFSPWVSKDQTGRSRYDTKNFIAMTINDETAAALSFLAKQIIEGTLCNPVQYAIQGNKNTSRLFEFDGEKARLIIEKSKDMAAFEFIVHVYRTKEDGQLVTKIIQAGLLAFAEVLQAYLNAVGADRQPDKQTGTGFGSQAQTSSSVWK